MPTYTIEILPEAIKQLAAIPERPRGQIGRKIDRLASDPFPPTCEKLKGTAGVIYRVRSGDNRILYTVNKALIRVTVVRIGDRKDIYRKP